MSVATNSMYNHKKLYYHNGGIFFNYYLNEKGEFVSTRALVPWMHKCLWLKNWNDYLKISAYSIQSSFPYLSLSFIKHEYGLDNTFVPIWINSKHVDRVYGVLDYFQINSKSLFHQIAFDPVKLDDIAQKDIDYIITGFRQLVSFI